MGIWYFDKFSLFIIVFFHFWYLHTCLHWCLAKLTSVCICLLAMLPKFTMLLRICQLGYATVAILREKNRSYRMSSDVTGAHVNQSRREALWDGGEVTGLVCVLQIATKNEAGKGWSRVVQNGMRERESIEDYRLLTARPVLFALQIAARVCSCLSGRHPAALPGPSPTLYHQHTHLQSLSLLMVTLQPPCYLPATEKPI